MKVKFKYGIRTYSGTVDEMTYGSYRKDNICIGRKYVKPDLTENNLKMKDIMGNLGYIYREASEGYRNDLKAYAVRNGRENIPKTQLVPSAYALFNKMMFAWAKESEGLINLADVTIEDIQATEAPVWKVVDAIEAGYLLPVNIYGDFDSEI
ncbi:MAG: hypothetical protein U1C33_05840 [Candidatus Cloacimonadaceae bacterium]|nr:hypothetical protein [Candidatus Cloacimonadaceae bacterium]